MSASITASRMCILGCCTEQSAHSALDHVERSCACTHSVVPRTCRACAGRVLSQPSSMRRFTVFLLQKTITQIHLPRGIILLPGCSLRHDHIISRSSPLPHREVANQTHTSHISLSHQCVSMTRDTLQRPKARRRAAALPGRRTAWRA